MFANEGKRSKVYDLHLAGLQRMVIHDLQHQLVEIVAKIHNTQFADQKSVDSAERLLEEYCKTNCRRDPRAPQVLTEILSRYIHSQLRPDV